MFERQRNIARRAAPRQQGKILENERDRVEALGRELAAQRDLAVPGLEQSAYDRQQGALAAAGRTDDAEHFSGCDGERHVIEHPQGPERMAHVLGDQFHSLASNTGCHRTACPGDPVSSGRQ